MKDLYIVGKALREKVTERRLIRSLILLHF